MKTKTKITILSSIIALMPVITSAQEAPTKQYGEGVDVPLVWILEEWHQKHQEVPLFLCVCTQSQCDTGEQWPFREYNLAEVMPALGNKNQADSENMGFTCGQVAPDALQGIGG